MIPDQDLRQVAGAIQRRRFAEADALLSRLLHQEPANAQARWLLVQSLEGQDKPVLAREELQRLLKHASNDLAWIDRVAAHARERRYPPEQALEAYREFLERQPHSAHACFNYAYYLAKAGQFDAAVRQYERSLELGINAPEEVHLNIATIFMDHLHDHVPARRHLESALELQPQYPAAWYNLGNLAEREGLRDNARRCFERCLQADPGNESALARLADTHSFRQPEDPLLERLALTAQRSKNPDVHFALGRAYEQTGEFELAWRYFSRGNQLDDAVFPAYDAARTRAGFRHIERECDENWLRQFAGSSFRPVFICGMFRSGSTLLEQMLAAHPAFRAGGERAFLPRLVARELPDYPHGLAQVSLEQVRRWEQQYADESRRLFGADRRLTDKRPDNFLYLGLIKAILPSAQFVVTERDWRDVAISMYSVRLGPAQSYARSLENIAHYVELQSELLRHWEGLLGGAVTRVRYEDLVREPQQALTRLLGWLGEEWNPQCLRFHELRNTVSTASVWQVREPLHDKSVGRWRNYEQQFIEAFGAGVIPA